MSYKRDLDGLVQDCSNSIALAVELMQSCTKPLIYFLHFYPAAHALFVYVYWMLVWSIDE